MKIDWTPLIVPNGGIDESVSPRLLPDNKWAAGFDVEPMPDGVRARAGKAKAHAIPIGAAAIDQDEVDGGFPFLSSRQYQAESFIPAATTAVSRVAVRPSWYPAGTPDGILECAIYSNNAGVPGTALTGAGFSDFNTFPFSDFTTVAKWVQHVLAAPVSLVSGTTYWLVARHLCSNVGPTDSLQLAYASTGPYASGGLFLSAAGSSWAASTGNDLAFRVYGPGTIQMIADYWLSDGATQRHLVMAGGELYKNSGSGMVLVSGLLRTALDGSVNTFPSWAVGQDRFFVTDGIHPSRKFYVLNGTEYYENEGIAPPTANIAAVPFAGGDLADGDWVVDYRYWNDDLGLPSNSRYMGIIADAVTVTLGSGDNSIAISGLPTEVAREGDRATHIRIDLKSPSGTFFRFAGVAEGQVTIDTAGLVITTDNTGDPAEYTFDVPPIHSIKSVGENRQFIGGIDGLPYQVQFSEINGTAAQYECFPGANTRDFGRGDGDYVTALAYISPSTIIVGGRNNTWAIDARHPGTSDRMVVAKGIGIAGHLAHLIVGRTLFFVSDADRNKGMYAWSSGSGAPTLIPGIDKTFKLLNLNRIKYASCAQLAPGDTRQQWWTLLSFGGGGDRILVYDYGIGAWTVYRQVGNVLGTIRVSGAGKLFIGGTTGYEYLADTGSDDDGVAYSPTCTMKDFDFGAADLVKRGRFVRYLAQASAGKVIGISIKRDEDTSAVSTGTLPLDSPSLSGSLLGVGLLGAFVLGSSNTDIDVAGRISIIGSARAFQPTLVGDAPWRLRGLALGMQPTGRR